MQGTSSHHSISKPWDGADNTYNKRMLCGYPVILMPTKIVNCGEIAKIKGAEIDTLKAGRLLVQAADAPKHSPIMSVQSGLI